MKRIFIVLAGMLLIGPSLVQCQGYYPLHVGDRWQYFSYSLGDTAQYAYTRTVEAETVMSNGLRYWVSDRGGFGRFERYSDSKIYIYNISTGDDQLAFDFNASPGDTVASIASAWDTTDIILLSISPGSPGGWSSKYWTMLVEVRHMIDAVYWLTIADSIGAVSMTGPGPFFEGDYLHGALIDGKTIGTFTGVDIPHELPRTLRFSDNYPNPFNPSTTIDIRVSALTTLNISVYNLLGGCVFTGNDQVFYPGMYQFTWTPTDVPGGVYILRIQHQTQTYSRKVLYLR